MAFSFTDGVFHASDMLLVSVHESWNLSTPGYYEQVELDVSELGFCARIFMHTNWIRQLLLSMKVEH